MKRFCGLILMPVARNANFFIFMYVLFLLCSIIVGSTGRKEAVFDLYIVCCLLTLLPSKWRFYVRIPLYVIAYSISIIDIYCFDNFGTTLTPSLVMLMGETNASEAVNFLSAFLTFDALGKHVWMLLLLLFCHLCYFFMGGKFVAFVRNVLVQRIPARMCFPAQLIVAMSMLFLIIRGGQIGWHNDWLTLKLLKCNTMSDMEKIIGQENGARFYSPLRRSYYSFLANRLAAKQVDELLETTAKANISRCSYLCPNIVLIIGESYSKQHSSLYGYTPNTTPRQEMWMQRGFLIPFTDVVSVWNITSYVFKNVLSTNVVGEGQWYQSPLFPALFKKAGYHVTFLSNEFAPQLQEDDGVFEFSGGFFLNHPGLSKTLFDARNTSLFPYDENLLAEYDKRYKNKETNHNLTIFHLIGQHIEYKQRYPQSHAHFKGTDYSRMRRELTDQQREVLAEYDNATFYNDSIVSEIIKRYSDREAVVVYVPDHGEECYEGKRGFICRNHYPQLDWLKAHYEYEVPFWIYCSPSMIKRNRKLFDAIVAARNRRYMTDALPHLLLGLAGIHTPWYLDEYDLISPRYNEKRPRLLNGTTDYDALRANSQR